MSARQHPRKVVTVRLEDRQHLDFKVAAARRGDTIQGILSGYVDTYITESSNMPYVVTAPKDPVDLAGCPDHPNGPKAWCINCKRGRDT